MIINPTNGNFSVKIPSGFNFTDLRLINYLGQTILNKKINSTDDVINIQYQENWVAGVYFISVSGPKKQLTTKLLIK